MAAIFQTIFSNAFSWMKIYEFLLIHSTLFVRNNWQYNIPALLQIMAWRRSGDKPLSEPMMVSSLTHISFMISQIRLSGVSNSNQWHYSFELLVAYIPIHDIYNLIMSITGIANSSLMYICIKLLISLNDIRNIISILMDRLNQVRHISNHNYRYHKFECYETLKIRLLNHSENALRKSFSSHWHKHHGVSVT